MEYATHSLVRTSPKAERFSGRCTRCGMTDLPLSAVGWPCENTRQMADDEALLDAVRGPTRRGPTRRSPQAERASPEADPDIAILVRLYTARSAIGAARDVAERAPMESVPAGVADFLADLASKVQDLIDTIKLGLGPQAAEFLP